MTFLPEIVCGGFVAIVISSLRFAQYVLEREDRINAPPRKPDSQLVATQKMLLEARGRLLAMYANALSGGYTETAAAHWIEIENLDKKIVKLEKRMARP